MRDERQLRRFQFDPDRVAAYEAHGWRAYYDRQWLRLLRLVIALCQEQFHIPFPMSLLAAYHTTRAAMAWAPVDHDLAAVQRHYARFYRLAARYSGLRFDPGRAAALETQYNVDHRRLVGQPNKSEFAATMTALHSEIFGIPPSAARESAELRVLANDTVDLITGGLSTDVPGDWARIERYLLRCYRSIQCEMQVIRPQPAAGASTLAAPDDAAGHDATDETQVELRQG